MPGVFFLETLFSPAGSGAEKGNLDGTRQYRNCQFFTPETRRSTHFFWNYLHDYDLQDANIALALRDRLGPVSIYALAKHTKRNYSNVHRDCAALEGHGLIEKDAEDRVFVPWSEVRINVAFGGDRKAA